MRLVDLFAQSKSVITMPDGSITSVAKIGDDGSVLGSWFTSEGLSPGDRVAVRLPNGLTYLEALVACSVARLVLVSVNTRYSEAEANDLIVRSGAKRVIDQQFERPVASAAVPEGASGTATQAPAASAHADDPFLVFTTSGTTSKPKMVRHTQRSIASHGLEASRAFGYTSQDVALLAMPFCGTFGMSSLTAALAADAAIVVIDQFDAAKISELIVDQGITVVNGSDDMFHRLIEEGADLSTIRLAGYARFNSSLDGVVERAESRGARLTGLYGMSEVQALFSLRNPSGDTAYRELAGGTLVSPDASYRIVDGELQLRGPSMFEGYLAEGGHEIDRELTGKHFDGDWFRTGDAAEADVLPGSNDPDNLDDRTFTYHSRIGDVLRLGGFLVAPADIEAALLTFPSVAEAQVVAVDLPQGARPVAFVILHPEVVANNQPAVSEPAADQAPIGGFDERGAIAHCQGLLARYKVPIRVVPLPEFPVTPSANGNKIQRVKLREMAQAIVAAPAG
jgi:fatty-acyl-CoA synthase